METIMRTWILAVFLTLTTFGRPGAASPFTVINANDSGAGSLRQAILDSNTLGGANVIHFVIGTGPVTITPLSVFSSITDALIIDGTTQPGYAGSPLIVIDTSHLPTPGVAFTVNGGSLTVQAVTVIPQVSSPEPSMFLVTAGAILCGFVVRKKSRPSGTSIPAA
jgi:hypothetical protein